MAMTFFPMDLLMDLCVLTVVQMTFGRLRLRRLLAAQALLSACTLLTLALGRPAIAAKAALPLLCAALLTGERRPLRILEAAACIFCAFAASAGFAALGGGRAFLAPLGAVLIFLLARKRRNFRFQWDVELYVERDGVADRFSALIDTGNRLREHRSGLPVLIVEAAAIPRLAAHMRTLNPDQLRTLPFGVLGGSGELECFRPDLIRLRTPGAAPRRAPDCWIAAFPGRIPGPTQALAPPEFAEVTQLDSTTLEAIHDTARRFRYGVFKRKAIHLRLGGSNSKGFGVLHRRQ